MHSAPTRIGALQRMLRERSIDICVVGPWPSDNLRYLLDYEAVAGERLTALIVSPEDAVMILPDFDAPEYSAVPGRPRAVPWTDRAGPASAVEQAFASVRPADGPGCAIVDDELPFAFLSQLRGRLPEEQHLASNVFSDLRFAKTDAELASIASAGELVSRGIDFALEHASPGDSEISLKHEIEALLRDGGAESLDFVLVQAGRNSASLHHAADATPLRRDEPVLVDIAIRLNGYFADITQQAFLGSPPDEYREHYEVVRRAQEAGVAAAVVGATAHDVAAAASTIIRDAGLSEWSGPRTGHGLGLSVHEAPSVIEGNDRLLTAGAVITVEPGIYLPGRYGIRIEDTVAVTADGPRRLTRGARPLAVRQG